MPQPANLSLFDGAPETATSVVQVLARQKPAGKAEQTFHRLVTQIERKREQLLQWQAFERRHTARVAAERVPLQKALRARQGEMALLLDELLCVPMTGRRLGKVQRAKLRHLLLGVLTALLESGDDEELEALYDKYAEVPYAQERQDDLDMTQAMLQDVFGMDIDQEGASSTEELLQRAQQAMQENARERMAQEQAQRDARARQADARAEAAHARRDQAAAEIGQSVREVFRKLASALHPDREPDPAERQRKTALMQRVNQAYAANDLLTLLGLQLEIEQIDAGHLAAMPPQRLAHFNQVLREQLAELDAELAHCVQPWRSATGRGGMPTPAVAELALNAELAGLRAAVREIGRDLVTFRDPAQLRDALAQIDLEPDDDEMDDLLDVFDVLTMAPRPGKRGRGA